MQIPRQGTITPSAERLLRVREHYHSGAYLRALREAEGAGPLAGWRGAEAQVMGGRLAGNLGAPRLAAFLFASAHRFDRENPETFYFYGYRVLGGRGPLAAWKFLSGRTLPAEIETEIEADIAALRARTLAMFRDFEEAFLLIGKVLEALPDRPWLWCEKAEILRAQDKHKEALECVQRALELDRLYRPSVRLGAEILQLLGRDAEALDLLTKADGELECGPISVQLATLQSELGLHEEALVSWRRADGLQPLAEKEVKSWLHARLADACYQTGRFQEAAGHAAGVGGGFYEKFSARLAPDPRRGGKILPVEFVAQHHLTCAPATLSALSRYWQVPVDHEVLAAEICYEGTFDHVERDWAERAGFFVKEFRLTWETACRLVDAGVPVTLTTVETTSGHLQALIGYDDVRETLSFRDPGQRISTEMAATEFFARYEAFGPRAMLMIPPGERERLAGITLPEADLYDDYHRLQRALEVHDRSQAAEASAAMEAKSAAHRLTLWGRRRLAIYDANPAQEVEVLTALLALYPKNGGLLWSKALALGRCASRPDYHDFLRELALGPAAEPVFWRDWGRELGQDKRCLREAKRYLTLALRRQPCDAEHLAEMANLLWDERDYEAATTLYRFAACLPGGGERFGRSYFLASRHVRKTENGLMFLQKRFEENGRASVQPARALINALSTLNQEEKGLAVLEQALAWRPCDGELLLFAADEYARHNRRDRAEELLRLAENAAPRAAWLRTSATLAGYRCDHAAALTLWREILELEPLAADAQRAVARFLAETAGQAAALDFLEAHSRAFPHHLPLHELHVDWVRTEAPETAERVIRRGLELHPDHAWLRRELALNLASRGKPAEALEEAARAASIEPGSPAAYTTLGRVWQIAGNPDRAREEFRKAIELSVDFSPGIRALFSVSESYDQKREAVDFVRRQLACQVVFGDGVTTFREEAYPVLDPEEMLGILREAEAARKDLWQTGAALAAHLADMQRLDEALEVARGLTTAFPLVPRVWHDLALVLKACGDRAGEIEALGRALAINPTWSQASRALAEVLEREGEFEKCLEVLGQAVRHEPLDCYNHGCLADILWRTGGREEAVAALEHALRLNPDYAWAWTTLEHWSAKLGKENRSLQLAKELAASRAGEVRSWLRLMEHLPAGALDEKLEAADHATNLDPRHVDAHDARAVVLAQAGRWQEALQACAPAVFGAQIPYFLRGREAWIEARRGHLDRAIDKMRRIVGDAPDYYWGWSCLADWLSDQQRWSEALEAARAMVRLAPRASVPLGHLASIQMRLGRETEALENFGKAFHLDPGYAFAGIQLFDEEVRSGSIGEARETLALLQKHHPGGISAAAAIRLACKLHHKTEALEGLRELCFAPAEDTAFLRQAGAAVTEARWGREAGEVYQAVVSDGNVNAEVGALWVEALALRKDVPSFGVLSRVSSRSPAGLAARFAYLGLATKGKNVSVIRKLIRTDGEALKSDTPCWAQVGFALTSLQHFKEAAEWLSDWRDHTDAEPWMLHNLAFSLRHVGRDAEAHEVSRRAVSLRSDHATNEHLIYLAWDDTTVNNIASARARLEQVSAEGLAPYFTVLRALVVAQISVLGATSGRIASEFESQKTVLGQTAWREVYQDPAIRRYGRMAVDRMAAFAGRKAYRLGGSFPSLAGFDHGGARLGFFFLFWVLFALVRGCSSGS